MYIHIHVSIFHLSLMLLMSFGFLAHHWCALRKRFQILAAEKEWAFVARDTADPSTPRNARHSCSEQTKREVLREIDSKPFTAKVGALLVATASYTMTAVHIAQNWWDRCMYKYLFDSSHAQLRKLSIAYERLTDEDARVEWQQLSEQVESTPFIMGYYLTFFGSFLFSTLLACWSRQVYLKTPVGRQGIISRLKGFIKILFNDHTFRYLLISWLLTVALWWYLDQMARTVLVSEDPYTVLDIPLNATHREIRTAYRSKLRQSSYNYD